MNYDILPLIGLETFLKIYKEKAAQNKIGLTESKDKQSIKMVIQSIVFYLKRKQVDRKSILGKNDSEV